MRWKLKRMGSVEGEMTKQEAKESHIPIESSKLWLRSPGPVIPETLIEAGNYEVKIMSNFNPARKNE